MSSAAKRRLVRGDNGRSSYMSFEEFWDLWRRYYAQWYRLAESVADYRQLREIEENLKSFVKREWDTFIEEPTGD